MSGLSIASSSAFSWVLRVYRVTVFPKASEFCLILRDATQAHADVTAQDDIAQDKCASNGDRSRCFSGSAIGFHKRTIEPGLGLFRGKVLGLNHLEIAPENRRLRS